MPTYLSMSDMFDSIGGTRFKRLLEDETLSDASAKSDARAVAAHNAANTWVQGYLLRRYSTTYETYMPQHCVRVRWLWAITNTVRPDIADNPFQAAMEDAKEWLELARDGKVDMMDPPVDEHEVRITPANVEIGDLLESADHPELGSIHASAADL